MSRASKSSGAPKKARRGILSRIGGRGRWPMKTFRWLLFLGFLGTLAAVIALVVAYQTVKLPKANADFKAQTTNVYFSDGKTKIGSFSPIQNRQSVSYDEISPHMKAAIVAAEDRSFWTNKGVSVTGILRALRSNAESGQITAGGSTITQQYVKILYLNEERTYSRKAKEAILSVKIARKLSKKQVLTSYLNTVFYGNNNYGVQVAATNYFNTDAKDLTVPQAAYLATVVNSPTLYSPYNKDAKNIILPRYRYVLAGMVKTGDITQADYDKYAAALPRFQPRKITNNYAGTNGFLLRLVEQQLVNLKYSNYQIDGGGLKVVTSFDKNLQAAAVKTVNTDGPRTVENKSDINSALVSVEPGTGAVRALYGGPDYLKSQLNWATLGTQPGSTMKAFATAAALEDGYSLNTSLDGESPIATPGDGSVSNEGDSGTGGKSYGPVNLRTALAASINTAFVDLTRKLGGGTYTYGTYVTGAKKIFQTAEDAGLPTSTVSTWKPVPTSTLGVDNISPLNMAEAYATILNGGRRADWYMVQSVTDADGTKTYQHEVRTEQTIPKDVAEDTLSALQSVVTGSGAAHGSTGANAQTVCPTAGKTGTATSTAGEVGNHQHVSSQWFIGLTPHMATAVMNNRGKNGNGQLDGYLWNFYGGGYPAKEFRAYTDSWLDASKCGSFLPASNMKATKGTTTSGSTSSTGPTTAPTTVPTTNAPTTAPTTNPPTTTAPPTNPPTTNPTTAAPTTAAPTTAPPTKKPGGNGGG